MRYGRTVWVNSLLVIYLRTVFPDNRRNVGKRVKRARRRFQFYFPVRSHFSEPPHDVVPSLLERGDHVLHGRASVLSKTQRRNPRVLRDRGRPARGLRLNRRARVGEVRWRR